MTHPLCKYCGEPYYKSRPNKVFCSESCKKDWETGKGLIVNKLEADGIINAESIKAALAAAGGAEGGG